jgi:CheY-like chemotaxis protein/chemotaxis signal transduction protein
MVVITVRDDGAGIDPERVRNEAIARGLIKPDQVLSENDIFGLIFQPGFSTAEVLSEESGRGVGLDVVRDSVARLKGTMEIEFMPGQGTAFTMKFPTSLAIQSAMVVRTNTQQFAIPMIVVETIGRLDHFKRSTLNGKPAIIVRNELYPLNMLSEYLGMPVGAIDDKAPLLLVNAAGHKIALLVDEIKGKMDVVMKGLGPHLRHVRGVAGGTILGNGRVVLILELSELLTSRPTGRRGVTVLALNRDDLKPPRGIPPTTERRNVTVIAPPPPPKAVSKQGKHLLIVDDSPSVRRVVSSMLKQHGWQVQTARDGVEALEMITNETPAAVLLDIEMPRMDGYELMATVRAQEQYRSLPLIILTSRAAAKHQQRAMQLGANAYVVKPYQDEELLNTLNTLVYGAAAS